MCVHAIDSCSYVEDSSLKSIEITVGSVSEGVFPTSTTLDKSKWVLGGAAFTVRSML